MFFRFLTYNKFKESKWNKLSPEKRLKAFQSLENIQAKKLGRPAYTVVPNNSWGDTMNGECISQRKVIELNSKFMLDPSLRFLGMATLFHEGRHAFQYNSCFGEEQPKRFSKAYRWKKNFEGYVNGENDKYSFYSMQPVERDANKYAIKRMKNFRFRYRNEPLFAEALNKKIADFEGVKDYAKKELGVFYKLKVALRNKKERKNNKY